LLSVDVKDQMKWSDDLVASDENTFDSACRGILMTIFSFMQDAMTADDDRSFEKLICDYLLGSDEFKEVILADLPNELRNNHSCATYLVWSLKSLFDKWVYESV